MVISFSVLHRTSLKCLFKMPQVLNNGTFKRSKGLNVAYHFSSSLQNVMKSGLILTCYLRGICNGKYILVKADQSICVFELNWICMFINNSLSQALHGQNLSYITRLFYPCKYQYRLLVFHRATTGISCFTEYHREW